MWTTTIMVWKTNVIYIWFPSLTHYILLVYLKNIGVKSCKQKAQNKQNWRNLQDQAQVSATYEYNMYDKT